MHIEFLVEEPSTETALTELLPKMIGTKVSWLIHPHQGKLDLIRKLPDRLKGYAKWLPPDWVIAVLIDQDRDNCLKLKRQLERFAEQAALRSLSRTKDLDKVKVVNRIAVEELEAWFFGDISALCAAYPGVSPTLDRQAKYRDPDAITGGTWEALERVLKRAGYFKGGLNKIEAARAISKRMHPEVNRSGSFCCFRDALKKLTEK